MAEAKKKYETLAEALTAFQADMPEINPDGTNLHFKSKYATLGNISKKVLPKLSEFGLSFSVGSFVDNGLMVVDAHLLHTSGTSRSLQFPITETNPQKLGSALTYARRYALTALTGVVADEDDDGNAASTISPAAKQLGKARAAQPKAAPKAGATPDARGAIRDWIGTDEGRKAQANGVVEKLQKAGKKGNDLYESAASELGI